MAGIKGFWRKKGRPGVRNLVAVIFTVGCAQTVAERIASEFFEARPLGYLSCTRNADCEDTIVALGTHPNVGAALVVALGCEGTDYKRIIKDIKASGREAALLVIQETGGTSVSIKKGKQIVCRLIEKLKETPRCSIHAKDLVVGIECGGSDATSGLTANTSAGKAADIIISKGGTVIVEEFRELIGCEKILESKAVASIRPDIKKALHNAFEFSRMTSYFAVSPGNKKGGLTTIEEKSLGAACKLGKSTIAGFLDRNERPVKPGLYLLDTVYSADSDKICLCNGGDINGNTCLSESHCHIIIFTTGRGNIIGAALSPVIKVTGNPDTYERMMENMDINAGEILEGSIDINKMGEKIFQLLMEVAAGRLTKSKTAGHFESIVMRQW